MNNWLVVSKTTVKMIKRALWICQHCNTKTTLNYQNLLSQQNMDWTRFMYVYDGWDLKTTHPTSSPHFPMLDCIALGGTLLVSQYMFHRNFLFIINFLLIQFFFKKINTIKSVSLVDIGPEFNSRSSRDLWKIWNLWNDVKIIDELIDNVNVNV